MIHKKFMDIQRIKPEYANGFSVDDYIVIQEKIDGCNKEEPETVKQIDNFGKVANDIAMKLARNIANER